MQNYFLLALMVTVLYVAFDYAILFMQKKQNKDEGRRNVSMSSVLLIFTAVCVSLFIFEKFGLMRLASLKTITQTPAFTNNPDF